MKKITVIMASILLSSAMASACLGGNLIQFVHKEKDGSQTLVATYDKFSGHLVSRNKSLTSFSIMKINLEDGRQTSACKTEECVDLTEITEPTTLALYFTMMGDDLDLGSVKTVEIENALITPKQSRPRGITQPVDGSGIYDCSKK